MQLDLDPTPPAHLTQRLADADAALEAHAAERPGLAAEYYARHEADQLQKAIRRLDAQLRRIRPQPRPRGRPADLDAQLREATDRASAAHIRREAAYTAYQRALAVPGLHPRDGTRLQTAWEAARARHEAAADALDALQRRIADQREAEASRAATLADGESQLQAMRDQLAQILAPLPDPPRAPLKAAPRDPARAEAQRRDRKAQRAPVPLTDEQLATLTGRYAIGRDADGTPHLYRVATGQRVRAATIRGARSRFVRTTDLLDALAPCGLV